MSVRALRSSGHLPSLIASLIHFEVSFGVWVMLGALGPFLAKDLHLSPALKGVVVGTPLLAAAVFRILLGWLSDRFGPRRIGTISMTFVLAPLLLGWTISSSLAGVLSIGLMLGVAGASFAVALPLASSHYPPKLQGLALGIAGAGNSGTIVTALIAPRIAQHVGWHATLGLAAIPVALAAILFRLLAREAPWVAAGIKRSNGRDIVAMIANRDCLKLCALYAVSFGGYVGFTSYLSIFLVDRFSVAKVTAGSLAALAAGAGSLARPAGGFLADRAGGTRVLAFCFSAVAVFALVLSALPTLALTVALFVAMFIGLGAANGAVFQLAPSRFRERMGVITGLVGAAGGIGGFLLPTIFGSIRGAMGTYSLGFIIFGIAAAIAIAGTVSIRAAWSSDVSSLEATI